MPSIPFVRLKRELRQAAAADGTNLSAREAHRLANGLMASEFANAAEAYFRDSSDETGETAVNNTLIAYLRKYGAVKAPHVEVLAA